MGCASNIKLSYTASFIHSQHTFRTRSCTSTLPYRHTRSNCAAHLTACIIPYEPQAKRHTSSLNTQSGIKTRATMYYSLRLIFWTHQAFFALQRRFIFRVLSHMCWRIYYHLMPHYEVDYPLIQLLWSANPTEVDFTCSTLTDYLSGIGLQLDVVLSQPHVVQQAHSQGLQVHIPYVPTKYRLNFKL